MKKRLLACLLTAAMLVSLFPLPALAAEAERPEWMVTAFDPLDEDTAAQTVPQGGEPVLPDSLTAWAYVIEDDTAVIHPPEGLAQEDEQPQADGPEEAEDNQLPSDNAGEPSTPDVTLVSRTAENTPEPAEKQEPDIQPVTIPGVTWEAQPEFDPNAPGEYVYTPVLPAAYEVAGEVELPVISVTVTAAEQTALQRVQALIDALPAPEDITADNRDEVEAQLEAIGEAWAELSEADALRLDTARLEAAQEALAALDGQENNDLPSTLADGIGDFTVDGGTSGEDYDYNVDDQTLTVKSSKALTISGSTTTGKIVIADGVTANITIDGLHIDVSGTDYACAFEVAESAVCNLTLNGMNTLKSGRSKAGLQVPDGAVLVIMKGSTGSLNATGGTYGAGIGGDGGRDGGIITIDSGTVTATGGAHAAGIGGGWEGKGGTITIGGGTITATCGSDGTDIGGGETQTTEGKLVISGGIVIATNGLISDQSAKSSWEGVVFEGDNGFVYGTSVTLSQSVAIPSNSTFYIPDGSTLTIPDGINLTNQGTIVNLGTLNWTTQNGTIHTPTKTSFSYIDANGTENQHDAVAYMEALPSGMEVLPSGWYVVNQDVTLGHRVTTNGNVHLILADGKTLTVNGGIGVSESSSLTIYGQSGGTGALIAHAGEGNAGIGSGDGGVGGDITINGGTVTATGSTYAAGIGGGSYSTGGNVTINGGTVTAIGNNKNTSYAGGAGIGAGFSFSGSSAVGNITITGGTVTATGYASSAGIGYGRGCSSVGTITISGGTVTAIGDDVADIRGVNGSAFSTTTDGSALIMANNSIGFTNDGSWSGLIFVGNEGQVYQNPKLTENMEIPSGYVLEVPENHTLTIADGKTLINNGTIGCYGTISGSVINNGTIMVGRKGNIPEDVTGTVIRYPSGGTYLDADGSAKDIPADAKFVLPEMVTLSAGWYVVSGEVDLHKRAIVTGDVRLILMNGCHLNAQKGITVGENTTNPNSLTIYAQSNDETEMGALTATASSYNEAGIGGDWSTGNCGAITINGGKIIATGGSSGNNGSAGIGGGRGGAGGTITINNGIVDATGGPYAAGIGGGDNGGASNPPNTSGTIVINGGRVKATGSSGGTGIGSGYNNITSGGSVTINGGEVTARVVDGHGAGIGSGSGSKAGTAVTINGGTVNATGGGNQYGSGAGIGSGSSGAGCTVVISGGNVTATGGSGSKGAGAGIGEGTDSKSSGSFSTGQSGDAFIIANGGISDKTGKTNWSGVIFDGNDGSIYGTPTPTLKTDATIPSGKTLTVSEGKTLTTGEGATLTNSGTIVNYGEISNSLTNNGVIGVYGTISGSPTNNGIIMVAPDGSIPQTIPGTGSVVRYPSDGTYLDKDGNSKSIPIGTKFLLPGMTPLSAGWYVVCGEFDLTERPTVSGDVHLILVDGCKLDAQKGITVEGSNSLTIYAQSNGSNMGALTATADDYDAGIGGRDEEAGGSIVINGGAVTATGDYGGAGIGGGYGRGGDITINGGIVQATGGTDAAGIGGGYRGGGDIAINGGIVQATGSTGAAGIGGGYRGDGGDIAINGGIVQATGGIEAAGIGGGIGGDGGDIAINGGIVQATGGIDAAGIGGGYNGDGGNITISGGVVTATGGSDYGYAGAGIGGGDGGAGGTITISGGVVTATGGSSDGVTAAGIGNGGKNEEASTFTTGDDGSAFIIASSISDNDNTTGWRGVIFEGNDGKVYGNQTLKADMEISGDKKLTIPENTILAIDNGVTLTNEGEITNNGTLTINGTGKLVNNGTITNNSTGKLVNNATLTINSTGKLVNNGTITNNSTNQGITGSGTIEGSGTLTGSGTLADTVKYQRQSSVTISFEGNDVTGGNSVPYGSTITIKATAAKAAANGLNRAAANQMEFFVGTGGSKRSLGTAAVDRNGTASLQITLSGADWGKGFQIGGNTITAEYGGSDYLAGAAGTATLTVNKLTPTAGDFTFNAPANLTYSGTAKEARVASTAAGMGKITVHYFDEAGKAVDKPENAGTYTVKIDVAEGENCAAASGLTDAGWTFTIAKATPPASVTKPLNIANHLKRTYTFALSNLRPAIVGGWGEVSYEFTASFTKPGYYTSGAEITPGPSGVPNILTLPIQFNDTTDEGKVGTVTVTLHSQNYGDYTGTISIVASNKTVVTFSGVEGVTTPYTGQSVEGYKGTLAVTTQNDEAVNVNDLTLEISYTGRLDTSYESTQPPTDVGTYFVVFRAADADEHYIGREHFAFEITKATPTGAPKYTAITTSGKTLADAALTTAGGTFSVPGTVAWELDETTAVEANTAYKWIFTPTDTHNYTTLEGSVTLWQRSSGGNTGGSYTPTYPPTVPKPSEGGGTPTVTPSNPKPGDTVTVTPKPDEGYEVDKITVTDKNGKPVEVTKKPDGTYTFKQPSGKVTIEVTYQPIDRPWNNPFTDVSEGDWYYEAVRFVQERGLMNGYEDGRFGPNDTLSRAQLAQILFNKEGRPGVNYLLDFSDVADEAWYTEAVRWAASQGIVGGYGNGTFGPNDPITREQLAVILWRYVGSPAATNKELHFNDTDEISPFALEALRWAVENGILNGYGDGRLGPQGQATRAQAAQMLKNFIENQEEDDEIQ